MVGAVSATARRTARRALSALRSGLFPAGNVPLVAKVARLSIGIYQGTSPTDLRPGAGVPNPVLTPEDITDMSAAGVADPFMIQHNGVWYMFFEVIDAESGQGRIGVAVSADGLAWRYQQIVLREAFHVSYPCVFSWQGEFYLMPEAGESDAIRLYRAVEFPRRWAYAYDLLNGGRYADSTLLVQDDWLYLFTCAGSRHEALRLYMTQDLRGPWVEHPRSPLAMNQDGMVRPAGRASLVSGQMFRYAQCNVPSFAHSVRAYRVTRLSPRDYAEESVAAQPVLGPSGRGWNADGMHHVDLHQIGPGSYLACVDGHEDHLRLKRRARR